MAKSRKTIEKGLRRFWPVTHWAKRHADLAPVRRVLKPVASNEGLRGSYVPVGEDLAMPQNVAMPRAVLDDFIERASHRFIVDMCLCRVGQGCEDYPSGLGCLLLGSGTTEIDPSVGRMASVEEARAHVDRALELGLVPFVGHMRVDALTYGIKRFDRFLTMCFCCPCCCVWLSEMGKVTAAYPGTIVPLDGLTVSVGAECKACGQCVPVCPVDNIRMVDGRAVIGDRCIGCTACVAGCERGVITIRIDEDSRMLQELRERVEHGVRID